MPHGNIRAHSFSRAVSPAGGSDAAALRIVILTYGLHTLLVLTALLFTDLVPGREAAGFLNPGAGQTLPFIGNFIKWDAHWYTYIAEHGYNIQNIVFFPFTSLLIKAVAGIGLGYVTAGFVVCNLFTLISYFVMAKLFLLDFTARETQRALLAYATLPTSFFLNSVYTEPVFIVCSLACLYCLRTNRWWRAGLFAALAALTRNLGVLLAGVLVYEFVKHYYIKRKWEPSMLSACLPVVAFGAFCAYNNRLFGNPLAFIHSQQAWGRQFGFPWDSFWNNFALIQAGVPLVEAGIYLDAVLTALTCMALVFATAVPGYRLPAKYVLTGWLWFLPPLFSTSPIYPLYSMARFVLVIFPLYLFLARLPTRWFFGLLWLQSAGLVLCTALFINWCWLG